MRIYKGVLGSTFKEVHMVVLDIVEMLRTKCGITDSMLLFNINFMLREVMNNAVEHGNKFDEKKKVSCEIHLVDSTLIFEVEDEGDGIDLSSTPFSPDNDYILRERHRGMKVIEDLNFKVSVMDNRIRLELDL